MQQRELTALAKGAKIIPLTQDKFAIVDAEDYERLAKSKWHAARINKLDKFYARRAAKINGVARHQCLHRAVLLPNEKVGDPATGIVDHREHDTLDCRKSNLRYTDMQGNNRNRGKQRGANKYKGVYLRAHGRCQAMIYADGVSHHLGMFLDPVEAAKAYDAAAIRLHGEFACLNFPATLTTQP